MLHGGRFDETDVDVDGCVVGDSVEGFATTDGADVERRAFFASGEALDLDHLVGNFVDGAAPVFRIDARMGRDALYFSREPIPSRKKGSDKVPMRKQVCIIPFRRDYLLHFNEMPESPLEIYESVDMMRILEHGEKVHMVPTDCRSWSVDTPEDLARVARLMEGDDLMKEYRK